MTERVDYVVELRALLRQLEAVAERAINDATLSDESYIGVRQALRMIGDCAVAWQGELWERQHQRRDRSH